MAGKKTESKATGQQGAQELTEAVGRLEKALGANELSPTDALCLALGELERLECVLDDLARSVRTMINLAAGFEEDSLTSTLRIYERVLFTEYDECCNTSEKVAQTLNKLLKDKTAASK